MKRAPVLNRKLVLEAPVRTPDGAGGFGRNWMVLGTLWAQVDGRTGRGITIGPHEIGSVPVRITVRGAPAGAPSRPEPDQRFRDGTRSYAIQAVTEADPEGRYLICYAIEGVAA